MPSVCFGSIKARVVRLTRLDTCGAPVSGTGGTVTSGGFISVEVAPEYQDGEEFRQTNAWGDMCVNIVDEPHLLNVGLTIEFCQVDPDIYDMVAGGRILVSGGTSVGAAFSESAQTDRFGLEIWSKVPGPCGTGGQQWVYWVFPNVGSGRVGSTTLELGTATFPIEATTMGAHTLWGNGPYSPSGLPGTEVIQAGEHWAFALTTMTPPAAACGATSLTIT
jgi:hypothetical protein